MGRPLRTVTLIIHPNRTSKGDVNDVALDGVDEVHGLLELAGALGALAGVVDGAADVGRLEAGEGGAELVECLALGLEVDGLRALGLGTADGYG